MRSPKDSDSPCGFDREAPHRPHAYEHASGLHAEAAGWDPRGMTLDMVRQELATIDRDRLRVGQAQLVDADLTIRQRVNGICALLQGPEPDVTTAVHATARMLALVTFMLKIDDASAHLGDAA